MESHQVNKTCTKCLVDKPLDDFQKNARYAGGHVTWCKECVREYSAAYAAANAVKRKEQGMAYYIAHKAESNARSANNYVENKDAYAARMKASRARRPEHYRELARSYQRRRRLTDVEWRLRSRLSAQLNYCLRTGKGGKTTEATVGYSIAELRDHLERQFTKGMSWENMGEWHIDHIVPLSSFTITGPDDPELRRAWALPNLRPLWAADNIAKSDKRVTLL